MRNTINHNQYYNRLQIPPLFNCFQHIRHTRIVILFYLILINNPINGLDVLFTIVESCDVGEHSFGLLLVVLVQEDVGGLL